MIFDLLIIGGGPAGVAAGVYAARKKLKTLFVTFDFGGQSQVSAEIQNWIGTKAISGEKLAADLKDHLLSYQGPDLTVKTGLKIQSVLKKDGGFVATADSGESFEAKTVLVTTGADRRRLEVPGAKEFDQKGITYCATCDGPLFADQDVVVIGGGNAAFESTAQLAAYCKSVTILHRSDSFRADAITLEKVKSKPNVKIITNAEVQEFKGEKFLKSLVYKNTVTGDSIELATTGVFVEIGLIPTTWFVKDLVQLNEIGQVIVDPRNQATNIPGIWAAGDCTNGLYHQNNIAAGDAIKALEDIYQYLHRTS
jgi:alkyl hydroperoxide reductase subunit F